MKQTDIESMTNRALFKELGLIERKMSEAQTTHRTAQEAFLKGRQGLADWAKPEKVDMAAEKYLLVEKDAIIAAVAELEDLKKHYNDIAREIDCRRMDLDQEKVKQGLA